MLVSSLAGENWAAIVRVQALEQLSLAQQSLAAIAQLSTSTAETLANVQESFDTTFTAIRTAITAEVVDWNEAIALWKVARRRTMVCFCKAPQPLNRTFWFSNFRNGTWKTKWS